MEFIKCKKMVSVWIKADYKGMVTQKQQETQSVAGRVEALLDPLCTSENIEFVSLEFLSDRGGAILRVCIDKPGGVNISDCAHMSRQIGDLMDVHFEEMGAYRLEVSSPGPKRILRKSTDFNRFSGHRIKIEVKQPIQGRRKFTGILQGICDDLVTIAVNQETVEIRYEQIGKARLAGSHGES
ncbi:ribosome maturation factor RimP [Desulfocicer niacini]